MEQFLSFAKYLDGLTHGAPLLKQLCDHVLFNAAIWIHTPAKVSSSHGKIHVSHLSIAVKYCNALGLAIVVTFSIIFQRIADFTLAFKSLKEF